MAARTISREQARLLDRRAVSEFGLTGLVLMENAGRNVADCLERLGIRGPVSICCGHGNNGGDGFVVARHLDLRGYAVRVLLAPGGSKFSEDAAANLRIIERAGIQINPLQSAAFAGSNWIVDALLGTGARGEPRPPMADAIDYINAAGIPVLAVDVPSGLDCDTGRPATHTITAAHTCTFVAMKPGFLPSEAQKHTGTIHVVDIGAPRQLVEELVCTTP